MNKLRILTVDDKALVRQGVRAILETFGVISIWEANSGEAAVLAVQQHKPDVVFMDISMSKMDGLEATSRIAKNNPKTKIIMLSLHDHPVLVSKAFQAGAVGYLLKDAEICEFKLAICTVICGKRYVSSGIASLLISDQV
jgi:DNA-binding NarL/FixJ family response regulator